MFDGKLIKVFVELVKDEREREVSQYLERQND